MNPVPHPSNEPPVSMASAVLIPSAQALKVLDTRGTLSPYPTRITPAGDDYRKLGYRPDSWIVVVEFSDSRRRRKRRNFRHLESPDRFPARIHKENSTAAAFINNCLTLRGKLSELSNLLKCLTYTLHTTIQKLTKLSNVERKSCDSCGSCCGCFCDSKSLAAQGIAVVAIVFPLYARAKKWGAGRNIFFFHIRNTRKLPQTIVPFDFIDKYYLLNYRKTIATIAEFAFRGSTFPEPAMVAPPHSGTVFSVSGPDGSARLRDLSSVRLRKRYTNTRAHACAHGRA
ncbi:hypothetical protein HNP83_003972 [Rhizobium leguminosarum]|nr:hypothetical protein [Rhizobium leguminosarum]